MSLILPLSFMQRRGGSAPPDISGVYYDIISSGSDIYAVGNFTDGGAGTADYMVKFNSSLTRDATFNNTVAPIGTCRGLIKRDDGDLVTWGLFDSSPKLVKISPTPPASVNTNYSAITIYDILDIAMDSRVGRNNSLFIGGSFVYVGATARNSIAKINGALGSLDTAFNGGTNGIVECVLEDPSYSHTSSNDTILIGGRFSSVKSASSTSRTRYGIARLNKDTGYRITDFNANLSSSASTVKSMDVFRSPSAAASNIMVAGIIAKTSSPIGLMMLDMNGNTVPSFNPPSGILLGGYVKILRGVNADKIMAHIMMATEEHRLYRLNLDGTPDTSFNGTGYVTLITNSDFYPIRSIHENTSTGDIFVAGYFNTINGVSKNNIAKLDVLGSVTA